MHIPVLLIHFNRPSTTRRQIEALSEVRPNRLWILCDAARPGRSGEAASVEAVRAILDEIPWSCEIHKCYRKTNLGIFENIASGISWFLKEAGAGIILEDDCLPSPTFFPFAGAMLDRYSSDERIFSVSGFTGLNEALEIEASYCFSNYFSCWGWATWERAWKHFDPEMRGYTEKARWRAICRRLHRNPRQRLYWKLMFQRVLDGRTNSWAYRNLLSIWKEEGLVVVPRVNLIENVGFNEEATNTGRLASMHVDRHEMEFPLRHPDTLAANRAFDRWTEEHCHSKSIAVRLKRLIRLPRS